MTVEKYLQNLKDEDIDLIDKLDNLCGSGDISDEMYKKLSESESAEEYINEYIKIHAIDYCDYIRCETENVFNNDCCEKDDWSAGLYNCDSLYMNAIKVYLCEKEK